MERTAIEKITELAAPNIIEKDGFTYSDKSLKVVQQPRVNTMNFRTLRGVVDTLKKEHYNFVSPLVVNVLSETEVEVYSAINNVDRTREIPYHSEAETIHIDFNRKLDYESMMITLKSKFVETPELLELVKLLGTITDENTNQTSDDGFSQTVIVRKGIALKGDQVIRPIIKLKPYRTFNEVDQPESEFLIRLSEGGCAALYEADGGAWKLKARENIAEYLRNELSELIENGALIVVE